MSIAHLTIVHRREDTRIRVRELGSIANAFAEPVTLFVQDGQGDAVEADGKIHIMDTGPRPAGRLARMTGGVWRMGRAVYRARARLVHFHDPELMTLGLVLKCLGCRVVYDAHEDVPRQALTKYWLPAIMRRPVSLAVAIMEWLAAQVFDAIVPAEPKIAGRFPPRKTTMVQNFPILSELVRAEAVPYGDRPPHFAYIGSLTRIRGAREMVEALGHIEQDHPEQGHQIRLHLAGDFQPPELQTEIEALAGWQKAAFLGWANRAQVGKILGKVRAGLVTLHPTQRYLDVYPTKMFEYMSASLPVIASDFPVWRRIVEDAGCGLLVDPLNPRAIAEAMQWILDNPVEAESMGRRGREAVEKYYNWETEAGKLIALYRRLLPA